MSKAHDFTHHNLVQQAKKLMTPPKIIYGTAWKKERTTEFVLAALRQGFRAIDTANQPKHYQEPLVGEALQKIKEEGVQRADLFLQTKFTPVDGQDLRVPYDPQASISEQVAVSFESSLKNLHTNYLDSYLLHGPYTGFGLTDDDWEAWGAIEKIYAAGKAKSIGISNVNVEQLHLLCESANVKPAFVQNRCYAVRGWDQDVRDYCLANEMIYQGFSLLTANVPTLIQPEVALIAKKYQKTVPQIAFRFSTHIGILPLTGTTNEQHMAEDLRSFDFDLTDEDIKLILSK